MVMNYTEVESKVREATNDEAWGPTGKATPGLKGGAREGGGGQRVEWTGIRWRWSEHYWNVGLAHAIMHARNS